MNISSEISSIKNSLAGNSRENIILHRVLCVLSELNKEVSGTDPAVKSSYNRHGISDAECCDNCKHIEQDSVQNYTCYIYSSDSYTAYCRPNQTCKHFKKQ